MHCDVLFFDETWKCIFKFWQKIMVEFSREKALFYLRKSLAQKRYVARKTNLKTHVIRVFGKDQIHKIQVALHTKHCGSWKDKNPLEYNPIDLITVCLNHETIISTGTCYRGNNIFPRQCIR